VKMGTPRRPLESLLAEIMARVSEAEQNAYPHMLCDRLLDNVYALENELLLRSSSSVKRDRRR
jgi:hypothetical protein